MKYRPEIDGLRAVAVIPVVLYHAGVPFLKGGFVGVDVFFVISGFLITSIIYEEIRDGTFTVAKFYERRIRRLFPALFAVILAASIAASVLFIPDDLRSFAQSVFATAGFSSNILFSLESGYFDAPAASKPLLHTWSLAVEEQFYILFPWLLVLLVRHLKRPPSVALAAIGIVSFIGSVYGVVHAPTATFYWLPTRAWELLLGACLVFPPKHFRLSRRTASFLSFVGLSLIVIAVFFYGPRTPFPGLSAVVPCLGTALIIVSTADQSVPVARLLRRDPVVQVGLWSYSLYLWHWPIIVFSKYYLLRDLTPLEIGMVTLSSIFIAWLSWRYIERPFRGRKSGISRRAIFIFGGASVVAALSFGLAGHLTHGFPGRLPQAARELAAGAKDRHPGSESCHTRTPRQVLDGQLCVLGEPGNDAKPQFLVWGDSHALAFMPAFADLAGRDRIAGRFASYTGCPPLLGIRRKDLPSTHECLAFNAAVISYLRANRIANVVLVARWSAYVSAIPFEPDAANVPLIADEASAGDFKSSAADVFDRGLRRTLETLAEIGTITWIVEQVPELKVSAPVALTRLAMSGRELGELNVKVSEHLQQQRVVSGIFSRDQKAPAVNLIDPARLLCDADSCAMQHDGKSLYFDNHHLSAYGARHVGRALEPVFRRMTSRAVSAKGG